MKKRPTLGHRNLLCELSLEPTLYQNFLRMNEEVFEQLLSMVCPLIEKRDKRMRTAISPTERLSLTLRFLASGNSFEDLKFSSYIAPTTISEIVMETTCKALCTFLKDYIKVRKLQVLKL